MKLELMLTVALIGSLFSCIKDDPIKSMKNESSADYVFPTEVGSIWIYENFTVDSSGNETAIGILDTVQITGQTVINGHTYAIYNGTLFGSPYQSFLRDSSGYVVNHIGEIVYSYSNFTDVLNTGEFLFLEYYVKMEDNSLSSVTVPAGTFNTVDARMVYSRTDGAPVNTCGDMTYDVYAKYDKEIGLVYRNCAAVSDLANCQDKIQKLISYSIP